MSYQNIIITIHFETSAIIKSTPSFKINNLGFMKTIFGFSIISLNLVFYSFKG